MSSLGVNSFVLLVTLLLFYQSIDQVRTEPDPYLLRKIKHKFDHSSEEEDHRRYHHKSSEENDDDFRRYKPNNPPVIVSPPKASVPPLPRPAPATNYYPPPPESNLVRPPVYFPPYLFNQPSISSTQSVNDETGIYGDYNTLSKVFDVDNTVNIPVTIVQQ